MCTALDGEAHVGALGITEAESGSDAGAMRTRAIRDGDDYVLNGAKRFITCGGIADLTVIFAREDAGTTFTGVSAFVVPKDSPGLSQGTVWKKMGIRASHTADLLLDDVRVPADHRLGPRRPRLPQWWRRGPGQPYGHPALDRGVGHRPGPGRLRIRSHLRPRAATVRRSRWREPRGLVHAGRQGHRHRAARLLSWKAGWLIARQQPCTFEEASKAKCFAADTAMKVTTDAVQVCGGLGFMREAPVEKWMRDAKIFQIFEGTNQIQRLIIGRNIAERQF